MTITNARPSMATRCARTAARAGVPVAFLLPLLLTACGGGSDSHPLMWQASPQVGLLQEVDGSDPDPRTHRVAAEAGPGGIVNPGSTTAVHGAEALFAIIADTGYRIAEVSGCGGERFGGSRYRTAPITAACTVTATFAIESYRVQTLVGSNIGGTVEGDGVFEFGAEATIRATPDPGYRFVTWAEAGRVFSDQAEFTFEVTSDRALSATFAIAGNVTPVTMPPAGEVRLVEARHAPAGVLFATTAEHDPGDGGAGIWRSEDGGESWTRTSERTVTFITIASGDPDLVIAGIREGGYVLSGDGGRTWTEGAIEGPSGQTLPLNDVSAVDPAGIFAAVSARAFPDPGRPGAPAVPDLDAPGLYRSSDAGVTWEAVFTRVEAGEVALAQLRHVEVSPGDPVVIHAATLASALGAELWRSVDAGDAFFAVLTDIADADPQVLASGVRVDPDDPLRLFVERYVSLNGGADWAVADEVSPRTTLWFDGRLLRVEGAALLVSEDGVTWTVLLDLLPPRSYDSDRVMLAEDALYLQLEGAPDLVHRIDLDLIREGLDAL